MMADDEVPRIGPLRFSAVDIALLSPVETYAVLVLIAGNGDAAVAAALEDAVRHVLSRTRPPRR
jgi:hypothetical protein